MCRNGPSFPVLVVDEDKRKSLFAFDGEKTFFILFDNFWGCLEVMLSLN